MKVSFFLSDFQLHSTAHPVSQPQKRASTLVLAMFDTNYLCLFFMIKHVLQQVLLLYSGLNDPEKQLQ